MKTAVEQPFSDLLSGKITDVLVNQDKYIQLEKQQIVDSYTYGWNNRGNDDGDYSKHKDGEDYYTQTYKP